ncbi:MAG: TatD family hydrolase [Saccharofermentans sp.]|nr:TatD family hydrolase [Saccharofermentans sp.]
MREVRHFENLDASVRFFDTHAHLYDERITDVGEALALSYKAGVDRILIPADSMGSSKQAVDYAARFDGTAGVKLFCSVGVHPHEAKTYTPEVEEYLIDCLNRRDELKIRALGEIGLDYYYDLSERSCQREVFAKQLKLAYELDIPFILHEREATGDCLDILRDFCKRGCLRANPGVCHCCSMSPEAAQEMVKMGFFIGFDGPITFKNNKKTPEVCRNTPLDRIVIETDSPYLTPEPNRGLTNIPEFVPYVCARIAEIKGEPLEQMASITYDNGNRLYEITEDTK